MHRKEHRLICVSIKRARLEEQLSVIYINRYFPIYRYDAEDEREDYARVKMMLHHPFRSQEDLLRVDGVIYDSFDAALTMCRANHTHPHDHYGKPIQDTPEQLFEDTPEPGEAPNDDHLTWEPLDAQ